MRSRHRGQPEHDSLLEYVSKTQLTGATMRGIDMNAAGSEGLDRPDMNAARGHGIARPFTTGGAGLDQWAEHLAEVGYPTTDEAGRPDKNKVLDLITQETRGGRKIMSSWAANQGAHLEARGAEDDRRMREEEARLEQEGKQQAEQAPKQEEDLGDILSRRGTVSDEPMFARKQQDTRTADMFGAAPPAVEQTQKAAEQATQAAQEATQAAQQATQAAEQVTKQLGEVLAQQAAPQPAAPPAPEQLGDVLANTAQSQNVRPEPATPATQAPAPTPRAPRAAAKAAAVDRTADAGAELTYNRRNMATGGLTWADMEKMNPALRVKEATKAKIWPKPDYAQMIEAGLPPVAAHLVKQIYDGIGAKPATRGTLKDETIRDYIAGVTRIRDALNEATSDPQNAVTALRSVFGKIFPTEPGQERNTFRGGTPQAKANNDLALLLGGTRPVRAMQIDGSSMRDAQNAVAEGWPAPQEAWQRQGYEIHEKAALGLSVREAYGRFAVTASSNAMRSSRIYKTREEADAALAALKPWIVFDKRGGAVGGGDTEAEALEAARKITNKTKAGVPKTEEGVELSEAQRAGKERRKPGQNISSEQLIEQFGFRGVNFGNWMQGDRNRAERQSHLNHAYDSFMDLADLLGKPSKAMSLGGMLGLAFGAQGRGAAGGGAAAHFVPGVNEINLTREAGAGSLAHEWAHALDHFFATQAGERFARLQDPFMSTLPSMEGASTRPEIVRSFKTISSTMRERDQTPEEAKAQQAASHASAKKNTDSWVKSFRNELERNATPERKEAALAEFNRLSERILAGDLGEGYVKTGRGPMDAMRPVMAEVRDLFKQATGRVPSKERMQAFDGNANHLRYITEKQDGGEPHTPMKIPSAYLKASKARETAGGKPYWATPWEMFARAFESYVMDRLAANAARNDYLVSPMKRESAAELHAEGYAYPMGEERKAINRAFDTLIDEMSSRTEGDNEVLFSRTGKTPGQSVKSGSQAGGAGYGVEEGEISDEDFQKYFGQKGPSAAVGRGSDAGQRTIAGTPPAAGWRAATAISHREAATGKRVPLRTFRGSHRETQRADFALEALGHATNRPTSGLGVYFTTRQGEARDYGPVLTEAHLDIRNPKVFDGAAVPKFDSPELAYRYARKLEAQGFDGIVIKNRAYGYGDWIIPFNPQQVILGADQQADEPLFQRTAPSEKPFFSSLTQAADNAKIKKAPAQQWINSLRNMPGVKAEELEWSGLEDWLNSLGRQATQQEVAEFLRANEIQVEETVKGDDALNEAQQRQQTLQRSLEQAGYTADNFLPNRPNPKLYLTDKRGNRWRLSRDDAGSVWEHVAGDDYAKLPDEVADLGDELHSLRNDLASDLSRSVPEADEPRYHRWQTPGGKNYREMLLRLPPNEAIRGQREKEKKLQAQIDRIEKEAMDIRREYPRILDRDTDTQEHLERMRDKAEALRNEQRELRRVAPDDSETYQSRHWGEPNVLAHMRFNERTDADGKRVLLIEEVQSDWHQAGRKHGYMKGKPTSTFTVLDQNRNQRGAFPTREAAEAWLARAPSFVDRERSEISEVPGIPTGVPDAPFKTTWPELAMKRMIRYAAENGFDRVAWVPGEQQAERYDLRSRSSASHVQRIDSPSHPNDPVWHLRIKIRPAKNSHDDTHSDCRARGCHWQGDGGTHHERSHASNAHESATRALDLKVGGEGMKGFYDEILPKTVNKLVKKWGGKVGRTTIGKQEGWQGQPGEAMPAEGMAIGRERGALLDVHSLDITPQMSEAALGGLPMFRRGVQAGAKMGAQAARKEVDRIVQQFKTRPDVVVVDSYEQLPPALRTAVEKRGAGAGEVGAMQWRGGVYFVASEYDSVEQLRDAVVHETVAHFGIRTVVDDVTKNRILDGIARDHPATLEKMGQQEFGEDFDPNDPRQRRIAAEEALAYYAPQYLAGKTRARRHSQVGAAVH